MQEGLMLAIPVGEQSAEVIGVEMAVSRELK